MMIIADRNHDIGPVRMEKLAPGCIIATTREERRAWRDIEYPAFARLRAWLRIPWVR